MPRLARAFVKTGLVCFMLSLLLGLFMAFQWLPLPGMEPLFWHLLMVGWITQIIFGVSMWMFPGRNRSEGFWVQKWGWFTYILLNTGLLLRVVAEPLNYLSESPVWNLLIILSACSQAAAAVTYTVELWPRIQSKQQRREQRKKKRKRRKADRQKPNRERTN
ncbi:cbb3-type cytochrome c oxidase subunit I [Fodinibius sediminis]|uniref:Cytochrome C and Quinol oxidase polypeptide I n=1 Tax=Fodinibius sediminis TaxID=1214077 RepID=A0A521BM92_9BACT|nr:cbb3-type cytochrome c oxidase subunit I [Fodinibius sediminis]SMO47891.1 hypothetical protein SAMN06265218_103212 [Fodinibius sediminis]